MSVCGGWSLQRNNGPLIEGRTLFCRSWLCPDCGPRRASALAWLAASGKPTTFLTLTVNPAVGQHPEDRARRLSDAWKIIVKRARQKFTKSRIEYLAVFEETKRGEPHLHILMRAPFIPQRWLSEQMDELMQSPIVDIRKVGHFKNAARYISKYIGKGPKPFADLKRYWSSQGYDLAEKKSREPLPYGVTRWRIVRESLETMLFDFQNIYGKRAAFHWWQDGHVSMMVTDTT